MQELFDAIQKNPLSSGAIAFLFSLLGLWVGNWQAVNRDRRKEFNAVAERVRPILEKQTDEVTPHSPHPNADDLVRLSHMLPVWKRKKYLDAVASYKASRRAFGADDSGHAHYTDITPILGSVRDLLGHIKYR